MSPHTLARRLVGLILAAALVAGCSSSTHAAEEHPTVDCLGAPVGDVAIVASGRQHSPAPHLDGPARQIVAAALEGGHTVTVVNIDGRPAVAAKFTASELPVNNSRAEAVEGYTNNVAAALASLRADDPQVDELAGLQLGADLVRPTRGTVLLLDNGLGTVAPADFTQPGVLESDPEDLANFLQNTGQIINLTDTAVGFINLGATTAPQPPLPPALVRNLQAIYTQLAAKAGARCSITLTTPAADTPVNSEQPVSLVPIPPAATFTAHTERPAAPIILDAATVRFQPNTAELVDPPGTDAVLAPIAAHLRAHPELHITITGTCATGNGIGPDPLTLSRDRAQVIADRFTAAGVDPSHITAHGVGTHFPEFVPDTDPAGNLLPGPAAQNRTVRITFT